MALESVTYLPDLNASNPVQTDGLTQAGNHLRNIKLALKNTFPNWTDTSGVGSLGALTATQIQIDNVALAYSAGSLVLSGTLKMPAGTALLPSIYFGTDATSGLYASATGNVNVTASGALVAAFNSTGLGITGGLAVSGNGTVGGTLGVTGATTLAAATLASLTVTGNTIHTGNTTHTGTSTFTGDVTLGGADGVVLPSGPTSSRPASPATAITRLNTTTGRVECWNGSVWAQSGPVPTPTVTRLLTGSGTYTPPTGCAWIRVRMAGGGAGGAGGSNLNFVTSGSNTTFGAWTAVAGSAPTATSIGGAGGTGGADGTGTRINRTPGSNGCSGGQDLGGSGGSNPFAGAGAGGGNTGAAAAGFAGATNTGAGGGSGSAGAGSWANGGGGAGEYVEFYVYGPAAVSYTVGAGGAGSNNSGGTAGATGGNGGSGVILIEEFYQ